MSDMNASGQSQNIEVVPGSAAPLSIDEEAIIEAGRRLLLESIDVSRDFAKQMITVSSGAIPIYVALLGIANLRHRAPVTLILVSLPSLVFFSATLLFVLALLPRKTSFSMQLLDEIKNARDGLIRARYLWIKLGLAVFSVGVISAVGSILALMSSSP